MGFEKSKLKITKSSFDIAFDLQDAMAEAMKGNGISVPGDVLEKGQEADIDMGGIIDAALSTISNKKVRECLFACAEKALYGDYKVNKDFFDKEENRELFYPIMIEIIKENVGPFMKGLLSSFGGLLGNLGSLPKQK